jgi:hypothetical protein
MVDVDVHEEMHKRYTQHLAQAMGNTREILTSQIMQGWGTYIPNEHEIEVKFDE